MYIYVKNDASKGKKLIVYFSLWMTKTFNFFSHSISMESGIIRELLWISPIKLSSQLFENENICFRRS